MGRNLNLQRAFEENDSKPLSIEIESRGGTFKVVGTNQSYWIRCISNEMWKIPFIYEGWDDVPEKYRRTIFNSLRVCI